MGESTVDDAAPEVPRERFERAPPTSFDRRLQLVSGHLLILVAVFAAWAAADAWRIVTGLATASLLSVLAAIPAGVVFSTLVHEWCHLLGARLAGARYAVPRRFGLFVFEFDYRSSSLAQFEIMSLAGQAGSVLAVLVLWIALPMDSAGRVMVVCAALGSGLFGALIEWPVLARARLGGDPLAELRRIDRALLYRKASIAATAAFVLWLLAV